MSIIVVESKDTGMRYAISEYNFDSNTEKKIRNLKPWETVIGFKPRLNTALSELNSEHDNQTPDATGVAVGSEKGK